MKVFVVSERDLFNIELQEKMKKYGELFFLNKNTYVEDIINDTEEKVVVYDPDFGGWNFSKEIIEHAQNLKAIFLGTTEKKKY